MVKKTLRKQQIGSESDSELKSIMAQISELGRKSSEIDTEERAVKKEPKHVSKEKKEKKERKEKKKNNEEKTEKVTQEKKERKEKKKNNEEKTEKVTQEKKERNEEKESSKNIEQEQEKPGKAQKKRKEDQDNTESNESAAKKLKKDEFTVWVGNLNFASTQDSVLELFKDCGKIVRCHFPFYYQGKNKGFCHIQFSSDEEMKRALAKSEIELDSRSLLVKDCNDYQYKDGRKKGTIVFVTNLPYELDEEKLSKTFGAYGEIINIRVPKMLDGKYKGLAFIEYKDKKTAHMVSNLGNLDVQGRQCKLAIAEPTPSAKKFKK